MRGKEPTKSCGRRELQLLEGKGSSVKAEKPGSAALAFIISSFAISREFRLESILSSSVVRERGNKI